MKWRQRIMFIFVALCTCFAIAIYLVRNVNHKTYRKDQISVGESRRLQRSMDIYPGKFRKHNNDFNGLHRELQGKSRSADQDSPDQDYSHKNADALFDEHDWLSDLDKEQIKLFKNLIAKISPDETTVNKVLKAAYLIVNETLGSNINNNLLDLNVHQTDLNQLRHFLSINGLLKSSDQSAFKYNNEQHNVPQRPEKVIVTPEELELLLTLKPRDMRFPAHQDYAKRKNPSKLLLTKAKLLSAWDG